MSVKKPFRIGLIIGVLALAFAAVPALASAAQLTNSKGVALAVGTTVTGTSTNTVTKTAAGELVCKHVVVNGVVTTNSGGVVAVGMDTEGTDTATECTFGGSPTTVAPTLTSINLSATSNTATFDFLVGGAIPETSTSTVTYTSGSSSIHIAGPVEGGIPGTITGDFALTSKGTAIKVD